MLAYSVETSLQQAPFWLISSNHHPSCFYLLHVFCLSDSFLRNRSSLDHEATAMMKAQFMSLWDGLDTSLTTQVTHPQLLVMLYCNYHSLQLPLQCYRLEGPLCLIVCT